MRSALLTPLAPATPLAAHEGTEDSVVECAWRALGDSRGQAVRDSDHCCSRCGRPGATSAVTDVVSRRFTGADSWSRPLAARLCAPCSWSFTHTPLRRRPHLILRAPAPACRPLAPAQLRSALSSPVSADVALTVPLSGRKHLLPEAQWGRIAVDNALLTWSPRDVLNFHDVLSLRFFGATENDVRLPTPPWHLLRNAPPGRRNDILHRWQQLAAWRRRPLWLEVALLGSRTNPSGPRP